MPAQRHTETLCAFHPLSFPDLENARRVEASGWVRVRKHRCTLCWSLLYAGMMYTCCKFFLAAPMTEQSCSCDATQYTLMGGWSILTVQNIQADYLLNVLASQSRSFFHSLNGWMRKCKIYRSSKPQLFIYLFFEFAIWRCCMVHHCADGAASK